jgi:DNA-binding Lrp family transcriptional regulator
MPRERGKGDPTAPADQTRVRASKRAASPGRVRAVVTKAPDAVVAGGVPSANRAGGRNDTASRRRRGAQLDDADNRLIELLAENGRLTNRMLAGEVGLTEVTVASRIRNLIDHRVLGVTAMFDWQAAGFSLDVWLAVSVEGRPVQQVAEEIAALQYSHIVLVVFGPVDLVVHAILPGGEHGIEFIIGEISGIGGVRRVVPSLTLDTIKYTVNLARFPVRPVVFDFPAPVVDLDVVDRQVIDALSVDGRRSNREVGRQLGLSEGTVRTRLRRLEDAGLLRICGQTNPYLVGHINTWACIGVDVSGSNSRNVAAKLARLPEVVIVALTAGPHDLFVFAAASSRNSLVELVIERIRAFDGVRGTETWEVVRTVKLDFHWARLSPQPGSPLSSWAAPLDEPGLQVELRRSTRSLRQ